MGGERLDDEALWHEFVEGKQTYSEIGRAHGVSARTVQRRLTEYRPKEPERNPGGHFSELKTKLRVHNGLSQKQKRKFITEFLEA